MHHASTPVEPSHQIVAIMPISLRIQVLILKKDHRPPHVHIANEISSSSFFGPVPPSRRLMVSTSKASLPGTDYSTTEMHIDHGAAPQSAPTPPSPTTSQSFPAPLKPLVAMKKSGQQLIACTAVSYIREIENHLIHSQASHPYLVIFAQR